MVNVTRGSGPLVLGMPHTGTDLPIEVWKSLNEQGKRLVDTDWHIDRLYDSLSENVTVVRTLNHRYVIDVNRSPFDESLYPGQNTTGLCPTTDFDGNPIYLPGLEPKSEEITARIVKYHMPYHKSLNSEINRIKDLNGYAILYDCHSIRPVIPFLFDGVLPDFSIGTNNGKTCSKLIEQKTVEICQNVPKLSTVLNGRFKGGWTTRNYGMPNQNIHSIQMELSQSTHLVEKENSWTYDEKKAEILRPYLRDIFQALKKIKKEAL